MWEPSTDLSTHLDTQDLRPKTTTWENSEGEWTLQHCWEESYEETFRNTSLVHSMPHMALCQGSSLQPTNWQSSVMLTQSINSFQNGEAISQVYGFSHEHQEIGLGTGLKTCYSACPRGQSRRRATYNLSKVDSGDRATHRTCRQGYLQVSSLYLGDRIGTTYNYKKALYPQALTFGLSAIHVPAEG